MDKKPLPHSIEAELAVIGSIFANPQLATEYSEKLKPHYFFLKRHQIVVESIGQLCGENVPPDLINVLERLRFHGQGQLFENVEQLEMFSHFATHPENMSHYLGEVKKYWELRRVVEVCSDLANRGRKLASPYVETFLQEAERVFIELAESHVISGLTPASQVLEETIQRLEQVCQNPGGITGIPTGFSDLDKLTAGFQPSDLIILAARPAMGKTSLVLNFASYAAIQQKKQVAIFSLEMSKTQLMQRLLSTAAKIQAVKFRNGKLSSEELHRLYPEAVHFQTQKLMIDDTPGITLFELSSRCRKMKREKGACDLIIIDYLQLMSAGVSSANKNSNREREISIISMGLKSLAKELNCPVIACAQLNRGLEMRPDKRPRPSDLRESGSIEQDADMICFIYRDEVYNKETSDKGIAEIIIGKNRHGPTDTVRLTFHSEHTSFHSLAKNMTF